MNRSSIRARLEANTRDFFESTWKSWRGLRSAWFQLASASLPQIVLVEADLFISYLTEDTLSGHFRRVVDAAADGKTKLLACSEVYDDIVTGLRSQNVPLKTVTKFVADMKTIPHQSLPMNVDIAATAMELYHDHGGSRKLHYFDSFHAATARIEKLPLLTSDKYMIDQADKLGIQVLNARMIPGL